MKKFNFTDYSEFNDEDLFAGLLIYMAVNYKLAFDSYKRKELDIEQLFEKLSKIGSFVSMAFHDISENSKMIDRVIANKNLAFFITGQARRFMDCVDVNVEK